MNNEKITIIGSGALATSLANVLHDSHNNNITIWGIDKNELTDLSKGQNKKYFPEVKLPKFKTTHNLHDALENTNFIIIAIPSFAIPDVYKQILDSLKSPALVINCSKGFYPNTSKSICSGLIDISIDNKYIKGVVSLVGPSHAEEIVIRMHTMVSVITSDIHNAQIVQKLFTNSYFKVAIETRITGAEICAAYKNILAIANGILDGLGYGINTKAALLTVGISEISFYIEKMKGDKSAVLGLNGIGDLIVTAMSSLSRNFTFGQRFISNKTKALKTRKTVEGLFALKSIKEISNSKKIKLKIVDILYEIIYGNKNPNNLVTELWNF